MPTPRRSKAPPPPRRRRGPGDPAAPSRKARASKTSAAKTPLSPGPHDPASPALQRLREALATYHEEMLAQTQQLEDTTAQLEASRDRFAHLYDHAPVGFLTLDTNGVIEEANLTAAALLGLPREALFRRPLLVFIHPEDRQRFMDFLLTCRRASDARRCTCDDLRLQRSGGPATHVQLSVATVRRPSSAGQVFLVALTDLTDRKRLEAETQDAQNRYIQAATQRAAAEAANRTKDRFLAALSHELRTPLTPVLAAISMLERHTRDLAGRDHLEAIRRNIELEARLIDDLLDVTRIANNKVVLDRKPVRLCFILDRVAAICQPDIQAKGLQFIKDYHGTPFYLQADEARLHQVYWNVLKNAVKFTPVGGAITLRCYGNAHHHVITEITDTGIGIHPDALPDLFNAFQQASAEITRQFGGLGLGLAITKNLVELHGGTITAHSGGPNKGATFRILLPTIPAPQQQPATSPAATGHWTLHAGHSPTPRLRILLVEDHPDTARLLRQLLRTHGHQVHYASDVKTALELTAKYPYDLIISDLGLPDRSGLELIADLRRQGLTTPALALSGYGTEADLRRSKDAGFTDHLIKPINIDQLLAKLATFLPTPAIA